MTKENLFAGHMYLGNPDATAFRKRHTLEPARIVEAAFLVAAIFDWRCWPQVTARVVEGVSVDMISTQGITSIEAKNQPMHRDSVVFS